MPTLTLVPAFASALALIGAPAESSLTLAIHESSGSTVSVTLECKPTGGTHPGRLRACKALSKVDGDFDRLPRGHKACVLIHAPVVAEATGSWRGRKVDFGRKYPNRCVAEVETSGVFRF